MGGKEGRHGVSTLCAKTKGGVAWAVGGKRGVRRLHQKATFAIFSIKERFWYFVLSGRKEKKRKNANRQEGKRDVLVVSKEKSKRGKQRQESFPSLTKGRMLVTKAKERKRERTPIYWEERRGYTASRKKKHGKKRSSSVGWEGTPTTVQEMGKGRFQ